MAIIQLKKVIAQNPKFVKAYQLLAFLYMKRQEYERARKLLKKAVHIDTTNTTTLLYLQEIEDATGRGTSLNKKHKKYEKEKEEEKITGTLRYMSGTEMVIQPTTFRDSSTIATFINIILGILLGGAIVWFLIVPANRQIVNDEANRKVTDANTKLATESVKVQELQDQIDDYVLQAERAEKDRDDALAKAESYEDLLAVANVYVSGDQGTAANLTAGLNADDFTGNAKTLYDSLSVAVQSSLFTQYYNAGTVAYYPSGDYTTAIDQLEKAVAADPQRIQANHYTVRTGASVIAWQGLIVSIAALWPAMTVLYFKEEKAGKKTGTGNENGMESETSGESSSVGTQKAAGVSGNKVKDGKTKSFWKKYPAFTVLVIGSVLLMTVFSLTSTFLIRVIEDVGGDSSNLGTALAICALAEVPLLLMFSKIVKWIPVPKLLIFSSIMYIVKCLILLGAGNVGMIYVAQLLQPFAYATFASASVYFSDACMEEEDEATGQTLISMSGSAGSVIGSLIGGWLVDTSGVRMMPFAGTIVAVLTTVVTCISMQMYRRECQCRNGTV